VTLAAIVSVWFLHLMATISPGPAFVVAVRTAAMEGFRVAVPFAVGIGAGGVFWAVTALSGLHLLFEVMPAALTGLKVVGGLFLIWIGWSTWRHAREPLAFDAPAALPRSPGSAVRLGILTQLANPKTVVFFGAVFAGLVPPGTDLGILALLLALVFLNEALWFVLLGLAFSRDAVRRGYARVKTGVDRAFGGLLTLFGVKIATS
jgi:threonine/homoserine/homoserine lactone efflux protein